MLGLTCDFVIDSCSKTRLTISREALVRFSIYSMKRRGESLRPNTMSFFIQKKTRIAFFFRMKGEGCAMFWSFLCVFFFEARFNWSTSAKLFNTRLLSKCKTIQCTVTVILWGSSYKPILNAKGISFIIIKGLFPSYVFILFDPHPIFFWSHLQAFPS